VESQWYHPLAIVGNMTVDAGSRNPGGAHAGRDAARGRLVDVAARLLAQEGPAAVIR
jgi:hypothetical protein